MRMEDEEGGRTEEHLWIICYSLHQWVKGDET